MYLHASEKEKKSQQVTLTRCTVQLRRYEPGEIFGWLIAVPKNPGLSYFSFSDLVTIIPTPMLFQELVEPRL